VSQAFCADPFAPRRRPTRVVRVGDVAIGGDQPIRVQSMTTTDTLDTAGTVDQVERLVDAGCEIVRITAPSLKEAQNLGVIAAALRQRRLRVPLVADIHYTPHAAMEAAQHVEKVRINPGNFADKKKFAVREYTDAEYAEETLRAAERFRPLVRRCAELGRALRIGTNHGSLADRIMNRYGDTPQGMVESALEFLDVCEDERFHDVVFSMKASNPQVAIQAYRLLAARLEERAARAAGVAPGRFELPSYPFHVGVTEAGDGEDGRVKSAIGIGALLEDGLGDTIRVSLTEDPVKEIPVALALARRAELHWKAPVGAPPRPGADFADDAFAHRRRATRSIHAGGAPEIGGANPVRVELHLGAVPLAPERAVAALAASLGRLADVRCEGVSLDAFDLPDAARIEQFAAALRKALPEVPLAVRAEARMAEGFARKGCRLIALAGALIEDDELEAVARCARERDALLEWELRCALADVPALVDRVLDANARAGVDDFLLSVDAQPSVHAVRLAAARLRARGAADVPIALRAWRGADEDPARSLLAAATDLGAPLCDGIGDLISLAGWDDPAVALPLGYRILQGARLRTSWTEYISCPSCGRTLFDLEETTARIRARTGHLKGLKIAVMGCIVNGPGEMADADFGYVGSGPGSVNLYVGKECVARHVPSAEADQRLVDLIRDRGAWIDPA
jgi:(E)-4-hydroxy-3-methylbut-2-enyl-diphosphate synthase